MKDSARAVLAAFKITLAPVDPKEQLLRFKEVKVPL
jgi:hypothetical protein